MMKVKRVAGLPIRGVSEDLSDKVKAHFGKRFKEWLEKRGLRLVDVSDALGLSYHYVAFVGKDKPYGRLLSPENAVLFAEIAGIDPDEVFSAMGQINPFLVEQVPMELLEKELLRLHRRLRTALKQLTQESAEAESTESA